LQTTSFADAGCAWSILKALPSARPVRKPHLQNPQIFCWSYWFYAIIYALRFAAARIFRAVTAD
jgi:hypothetical protein